MLEFPYVVHFCQIRIGKIEHWTNILMKYKLNVMKCNQVQPNSTNSEQSKTASLKYSRVQRNSEPGLFKWY